MRRRSRAASDPAGSVAPWWPTTGVDHAPGDLGRWLQAAGFRIDATRSVSLFRLRPASRRVPLALLIALERALQSLLAPVTPGPSIFLRAIRDL